MTAARRHRRQMRPRRCLAAPVRLTTAQNVPSRPARTCHLCSSIAPRYVSAMNCNSWEMMRQHISWVAVAHGAYAQVKGVSQDTLELVYCGCLPQGNAICVCGCIDQPRLRMQRGGQAQRTIWSMSGHTQNALPLLLLAPNRCTLTFQFPPATNKLTLRPVGANIDTIATDVTHQ
jgi:hypothetical protein